MFLLITSLFSMYVCMFLWSLSGGFFLLVGLIIASLVFLCCFHGGGVLCLLFFYFYMGGLFVFLGVLISLTHSVYSFRWNYLVFVFFLSLQQSFSLEDLNLVEVTSCKMVVLFWCFFSVCMLFIMKFKEILFRGSVTWRGLT